MWASEYQKKCLKELAGIGLRTEEELSKNVNFIIGPIVTWLLKNMLFKLKTIK